jgi:predicted nuclease with TOPRIM domain
MTPDQERLIRIEEGVSFLKETAIRDREEVSDLKKRVDVIEPKVLENTVLSKIIAGGGWLFCGGLVTFIANKLG